MFKFGNKMQYNALMVHLIAIIGLYFYWDPYYLIFFLLGHKLIMGVGHDIGLHRYFSHRSFKTTKFYETLFVFLAWFNIQGSTISWVLRHRYHHAFSDKENDPHPAKKWFKTWFWIEDNREKLSVSPMIVKDLLKNKLHIFMHEHYFMIYWLMILSLILITNFKFVLYFFILNSVMGFYTAGMINVLCHKFGYRNFNTDDNSRNLTWVNYIHFGVGLHNNHHAFPQSYTNKVKDFEFDPSAWLIKNIFATNAHELKEINYK